MAATLHRATGEPRFVPMVMTDHTTGLIAAQAIGFALLSLNPKKGLPSINKIY